MKHLIFIIMTLTFAISQTVTPSTQACVCSNLLNQADCQSLLGCQWSPPNYTETQTINTTKIGSCGTYKTPYVYIHQFCGSSFLNSTECAKTIGCVFFNTWNPSTNSCSLCASATITPNNTNTTNNSTGNSYGYLISIIVTLIVLV